MSWSNFIFAIAAVAVHELGHVLCAAALGIPIISLGAKSVGGVISFDFSRSDYVSEILVHLSGPLCGIAAAVSWKICRATSLISSLVLWGTVVFIELRVLPNLGLLFFAIWVLMEEVKRK